MQFPTINFRTDLYMLLDYLILPKIVAEVGVAEGWFTKEILKWDLDKLILVDNWATIQDQSGDGNYHQSWHDKNYKEVLERIKPFGDKATVLKGLSTEMAEHIQDNTLGLCYIDACHEQECVKKDLEAYYPKVVNGGIIAGHDYLNMSYGVNNAVREFCEGRFEIFIVPDEDASMSGFWFIK